MARGHAQGPGAKGGGGRPGHMYAGEVYPVVLRWNGRWEKEIP